MKLEDVEYKECARCAEFGYKLQYPMADAVKKKITTGERIFTGEFKKHKRIVYNPCGRDVKRKETGHWKELSNENN